MAHHDPPRIGRKAVQHVAKLAALSLDDAEADRFAEQLARIVAYVEDLNAEDTSDVPPTANVELDPRAWRPDEGQEGVSHEEALRMAPRVEDGGFAVPTFVEDSR